MKQPSQASIDAVRAKETERLRTRRMIAHCDPGDPAHDAVGLALSGGGIRSATFSLGFLQAMERWGFLKRVDYLSTVSGGGYIGSCLTWFMSVNKQEFPFGTTREDYKKRGDVLAWLREHGNYLTPGGALNLWALIGAVLAGTLASLIVLVPVFLALVFFLGHPFLPDGASAYGWLPALPADRPAPNGFAWLLSSGAWLLAAFLMLAFLYALGTSISWWRKSYVQRWVHAAGGFLLALGVLLVLAGAIPWVYELIRQHARGWIQSAMSAISLSGALSMWGALRGRKPGAEGRGWRALLLGAGLALAIYGLFLWFYHLVGLQEAFPAWLRYLLAASVLIAVFANINHVSMHRFYRNRLMEAYMPEGIAQAASGSADLCRLLDIPQRAAPYHLINANVQLTGSGEAKYRTRGGDSFFFSPEYCGSSATGFVATRDYVGGGMNLATAFAISGAAVDPNTYATRSRPLTFLMTLFNTRLGYWIRNPRHPAWLRGFSRPRWYWYLLREMFGSGLDEDTWHIHLSDGGHFENLGLYELVRRRCRYIIVCDAGADPGFGFSDLARAIELVRTDFGAAIDLKVEPIRPRGDDRLSSKAFVAGDIYYSNGTQGRILYVKATMLDDLPEDVNGYRREHHQFPHQTTADQFFDEAQFEAYRELGYWIGARLFKPHAPGKLDSLFEK